MSRILIEYMPMLTVQGEKAIKNFIIYSMISENGDTSQYDIDIVAEFLEKNNFVEDLEIIKGFINEGVNYIEI